MKRLILFLALLACGIPVALMPAQDPPAAKLLIAVASHRERRVLYPKTWFYEHDGVASGKVVGATDALDNRSDRHPSLSPDGRYCAVAAKVLNTAGRILLWDVKQKKFIALPAQCDSPNAQMSPSLAGEGQLLAFAAWSRPGAGPRWDVFVFDMAAKKFLDLPGMNTPAGDERMPALSGNGRFLAYTTNAPGGVGLTDICLYDLAERKARALPEMNSKHMDIEPSLSADGRLIAFVSDRPGGSGGRDIYLFDRAQGEFLPLPGLNSAAHEQSPSLSPDGRFLAFVSERLDGTGERDIYLYDRQARKLLPTPGLNSKEDDFDPSVCVLRSPE